MARAIASLCRHEQAARRLPSPTAGALQRRVYRCGVVVRCEQGNSRRSSKLGAATAPVAVPLVPRTSRETILTQQAAKPCPIQVVYPLTYYDILRVPKAASREAVRKAYQDLVMPDQNQTEYSSDTLFRRAVILKAAAECLMDLELRRAYDERIKQCGPDLRVSHEDVPGALALLQEAGRYDLVISTALQWIDQNGSNPDVRDVACCLALARWDRASRHLQRDEVASACADLQSAQALMHRYDVLPHLLQQVEHTLQDYAAQQALELLALPLTPEHAQTRAQGLALFKAVVRDPGTFLEAPLGPNLGVQSKQDALQDYLAKAREVLTAQAQVDLASELRVSPFLSKTSVMYDTALALMALGLTGHQPHFIHRADRMLATMESGAMTKPNMRHRQGQDASRMQPGYEPVVLSEAAQEVDPPSSRVCTVAVERATCMMLLGQPGKALTMLGMGAPGRYDADPDVKAFVQEHSEGGSDLLPGAYLLTQRWVNEALLPSFRENSTADQEQIVKADFQEWFSHAGVRLYLKAWAMVKGSPLLLEAAHMLVNLPRYLAAAWAAAAAACQAFMHRLAPGNKQADSAEHSSAMDSLAVQRSAATSQPTASAARSVVIGAANSMGKLGSANVHAASVERRLQMELDSRTAAEARRVRENSFTAKPLPSLDQGEEAPGESQQHVTGAAPGQSSAAALTETGTQGVLAGRRATHGAEDLTMDAELDDDEDSTGTIQSQSTTLSASELRAQLHQMERAMWDSGDVGNNSRPMNWTAQIATPLVGLGALVLIAYMAVRDQMLAMQASNKPEPNPSATAVVRRHRSK